MYESNELKARIEHEKNNLRFYALFYADLEKRLSRRELEKQIDTYLDRLIDLLKLNEY